MYIYIIYIYTLFCRVVAFCMRCLGLSTYTHNLPLCVTHVIVLKLLTYTRVILSDNI